jgi:hypothetical protein
MPANSSYLYPVGFPVAGPSSPDGWVLLNKQTFSGVNVVYFNNLNPRAVHKMYINMFLQVVNTSNGVSVTFNNDAASNYQWTNTYQDVNSSNSFSSSSDTKMVISSTSGVGPCANSAFTSELIWSTPSMLGNNGIQLTSILYRSQENRNPGGAQAIMINGCGTYIGEKGTGSVQVVSSSTTGTQVGTIWLWELAP